MIKSLFKRPSLRAEAEIERARIAAAADRLASIIGLTETLQVLDAEKRRLVREEPDNTDGWIA